MVVVVSGHPDNVAPAIYGGIQLGIHTGERWMTERVNTPPGIQVTTTWDFMHTAERTRGFHAPAYRGPEC